LTLYNIGFRYAVRELVAALNMHHLRSLKLRSYYSSAILHTIAELAEEYNKDTNRATIPLTCLDITLRPSGDQRDTEFFEQFFAVSPYLRDLYIQLDAFDQSSFKPHLRAIFTPERLRGIKRFIYQRRLQVEGDVCCAWDDTDAPMVWDEEVRWLFAKSQMTHVGICDHLPTLVCTPPPPVSCLPVSTTTLRQANLGYFYLIFICRCITFSSSQARQHGKSCISAPSRPSTRETKKITRITQSLCIRSHLNPYSILPDLLPCLIPHHSHTAPHSPRPK
jgi:hypothetical protein